MSRLAMLLATLLLLWGDVGPASAAPAWTWPLSSPGALSQPEVTRPFGLGPSVYAAGHRGADLVGAEGQPVLAAGAGRVTYASRLAGRGVVTVTHGSLRTTYEPVSATVRVGAQVGLGEQIGTLEPGHVGCPVAACLHWGLKRGDTYLDPLRLVQQGPVRLLTPGEGPAAPRGQMPVDSRVRLRPAVVSGAATVSGATPPDPAVLSGAQPGSAVPDPGVVSGAVVLGRVDQERAPSGGSSVAAGGRGDRRLAAGLTLGAAGVLVARSSTAVRRRGAGIRSSGVGR